MVHPAQSPVKGISYEGLGAEAVGWGYRITSRQLGRPDDVDGGVEGGGPVAAAVTRTKPLAKASLGIVGGERMAAGARNQGIHRANLSTKVATVNRWAGGRAFSHAQN
jgi:hypothetical protein